MTNPAPSSGFRFTIQTFGCQMNAHDSDRMASVLRAAGGRAVPGADEADLVVLNTCSVREKAEQKLRSEVGKLAPLKRARPEVVIAVAGCVAQQEGEALLARIPHVDLVVGPDNIAELPALYLEQDAGAPRACRTAFDLDAPRFLAFTPEPGHAAPVSAFVTTMKGCDERCSFCIVPTTRGPERYRPAADILGEVHRFVLAGAREIVLLGQTVDSFRDPALPPADSDADSQFCHLLRAIAVATPAYASAGARSGARSPGLARLRYTSPHPRHATAALARAHAELDVLARHVHLPAQSGSDRMLRRMIRRYTRAEYVARADRLRCARQGMTLSTDIIVGFPGETDADFEETLSLVREVGFVSLFGFKYSPRPRTPALRLGDDIPEAVKSERLARLFELAEALGGAHLAALVGTSQKVLIEGRSKADKGAAGTVLVQGRTDRNEIVHVEIAPDREAALVGEVAQVDVKRANRHSLFATLRASDGGEVVRVAASNAGPAARFPRRLPLVSSQARAAPGEE